MTSLQGSLQDEGAMAERLRRFRVRRSTRNLGFRLVRANSVCVYWHSAIGVARVKNGDACLGCCAIGVMVHEKRNCGCSAREDERSSQAQTTWQRVKRQADIRRGLGKASPFATSNKS
ncbi:uncharacterized protein HKW66_Vig0087890 [Vigna angularis]|uniref:Uncharacterized protein n=1 Tax=Phaseolus angularis TaxID=3914 RepID=A0A8T0KFS6_PHAAN|nr:uncharacterized protein HKW66_Vig0087890 [Vigna angularis]